MKIMFKRMFLYSRYALFVYIALIVVSAVGLYFYFNQIEVEDNIPVIQTKNNVETKRSNNYSWKTAYDIQFDGESVDVKVLIKLVRDADVRPLQVENVEQIWRQKIKSVWSSQYAIQTDSGLQYPINVSAEFARIQPHHEVIIRRSSKKVDEYNWGISTNPNVIAHEFGHMIGAFDEYPGGAINPVTKRIDLTNIMGNAKLSSKTYPRHYKSIQEWFVTHVEPNVNVIYIGPDSKDL